MELAETAVANSDRRNINNDADAAAREGQRSSIARCHSAGQQVSDGHGANERQDKHAHNSPAHFVSYQFVKQRIDYGNDCDDHEPNAKQEYQ